MDDRKSKLELARKKLKDHQEKKSIVSNKGDLSNEEMYINSNGISNVKNLNVVNPNMDNKKKVSASPTPPVVSDSVFTAAVGSYQRNTEIQIKELQQKIESLESNNVSASKSFEMLKQHNSDLQAELSTLKDKHILISNELSSSTKYLSEYKSLISTLNEEKNNLIEHLELTKNIVSKKETEISALNSKLENLHHDLEISYLKLQQLNSGNSEQFVKERDGSEEKEKYENLMQKNAYLEQQHKLLQNERNQITSHYEHYVSELNAENKLLVIKNEEMLSQIQYLTTREANLIEQISDLEIQLQHLKSQKNFDQEIIDPKSYNEMENQCSELKNQLLILQRSYDEARQNLAKTHEKLIVSEQRTQHLEEKCKSIEGEDTICLAKLNVDIANDKVAAQRATEQNRKLKKDLQELEDDFVKMSKDKLEMTEKLEAEKFLNKELTLKLADVVEKYEEAKTRVNAKDEEMIRLQSTYRDIARQIQSRDVAAREDSDNEFNREHQSEDNLSPMCVSHEKLKENYETHVFCHNHNNHSENNNYSAEPTIPKEDAMCQLQDRFLKIMGEVADLSDEKHRLEHIIAQLQTETETICEYVALYQQQRSLLKKRDDERGEQLVKFQEECEKMRGLLGKLTEIILKLTENKHLTESNGLSREDVDKALAILQSMEMSFIVNPKNNCDMKEFYPCACCSGVLINV